MKSVLISIQPKWCELIASGKKTIEVRKSVPKLETPFKCYIYCTAEKHKGEVLLIDNKGEQVALGDYRNAFHWKNVGNGKVISEFVCDKVDTNYPILIPNTDIALYNDEWVLGSKAEEACLTLKEIAEYGKGKPVYGWHISDLVIYDKPKELSEFYRKLPEKILESGDYDCRKGEAICIDYPEGGDCCEDCIFGGRVQITRPPQSWCYVEELRK